MSLAIRGSYEAYVWVALWQISLGCLQSGLTLTNVDPLPENWSGQLQYNAGLVATGLSWAVWGLSAWVGVHHGLTAGVVFAIFSAAANAWTAIELRRFPNYTMYAQIAGLLVMPLCAFNTLVTVGAVDLTEKLP
jgi:hypothetical protein